MTGAVMTVCRPCRYIGNERVNASEDACPMCGAHMTTTWLHNWPGRSAPRGSRRGF